MLSKCTDTWLGMIARGATTTAEAWIADEKPNLTFSHPWGASPAFAIPRFLFGLRPLTPGHEQIEIKPQLGSLEWANFTLPTLRGAVTVNARQKALLSC